MTDEQMKELAELRVAIQDLKYQLIQKYDLRELSDDEVSEFIHQMILCCQVHPNSANINVLGLAQIVKDILKKASEK